MRGGSFLTGAVKHDNRAVAELPLYLADRFGWDEYVMAVSDIYRSLTPAERAECVVYSGDYTHAGAVDVIGLAYGLPPAISGHLSYYYWGTGERSGEFMIATQIARGHLERLYGEVEIRAVVRNPYGMPYNTEYPVFLCRKPRFENLSEIWPQTRHFD